MSGGSALAPSIDETLLLCDLGFVSYYVPLTQISNVQRCLVLPPTLLQATFFFFFSLFFFFC